MIDSDVAPIHKQISILAKNVFDELYLLNTKHLANLGELNYLRDAFLNELQRQFNYLAYNIKLTEVVPK